MDCAHPSTSTAVDRAGATLHSGATRADGAHAYSAPARLIGEDPGHAKKVDSAEKDRVDYSFIYKLISNAIHCQNIAWLTSLDFDFMTNVLDMSINRSLIGFKCDPMNCIQ